MPLRTIICGRNTIAVKCTEMLRAHPSVAIVGVIIDPRDDGTEDWQLSLKKYAQDHTLPIIETDNINAPEMVAKLQSLEPDLLFSFQYYKILSATVITVPKYGCVNLHFAPLPKYRGVAPIAWALINGETEFGITLHYIDPGVDTGAIIAQRRFPVSPTDNGRTLYEKCIDNGVTLFAETNQIILDQKNTKFEQTPGASYYNMHSIDFKQNWVDWNQSATTLHNWIRAFIFPPFQFPRTQIGERVVEITGIAPSTTPPGDEPGTVLEVSLGGITVAATDGTLMITGLREADGKTLPLSTIHAGDRFVSPPAAQETTRIRLQEIKKATQPYSPQQ